MGLKLLKYYRHHIKVYSGKKQAAASPIIGWAVIFRSGRFWRRRDLAERKTTGRMQNGTNFNWLSIYQG